jgi:hypothetical protein
MERCCTVGLTCMPRWAWRTPLCCELHTHASMTPRNLQVLHFLREVLDPPCPFSTATAVAAASGGHLAILQYLAQQQQQQQQQSCSCWSPAVCAAAAAGGHQHVLQWLRHELDPACPWDHNTCRWVVWWWAACNTVLLLCVMHRRACASTAGCSC